MRKSGGGAPFFLLIFIWRGVKAVGLRRRVRGDAGGSCTGPVRHHTTRT